MIVEMTRVRLLGPRPRLEETLRVLQHLGLLHLAPPRLDARCHPCELPPERLKQRTPLSRLVDDLESILTGLGYQSGRASDNANGPDLVAWIDRAPMLRAEVEALGERLHALHEERALIAKYRELARGFEALFERAVRHPAFRIHSLVLRSADTRALAELEDALTARLGDAFQLVSRRLDSGEVAVVLLVSAGAAQRVETLLAQAPLERIPVPSAYHADSLGEALPRMMQRLDEIPAELAEVEQRRKQLSVRCGREVAGALAAAHDGLVLMDALEQAATTQHAFVIEGWIPAEVDAQLVRHVAAHLGPEIVVERVAAEQWAGEPAPIALKNPRIIQPFEVFTRLMPLPRYGSIDPTPFFAVGFPMLFGLILGDIGYGIILAGLALLARLRSATGSRWRVFAAIAAACSFFTVVFGLLYGELFGDVGRHLLGLQPVAYDREEAVVPALIFALGLGFAHVLLGLVLGVVSNYRRARRKALASAATALILVLLVLALLGVFGLLPEALVTPLIIAALVVFPVLVVVEGILAPIELMSTLAKLLSYARVMAVGTASVLMAVVANKLAGALGSILVGALFALVFHAINFVIGVFSPTVHVLRLHYVEFMGLFYSPGGSAYRPLGHWSRQGPTPTP